MCNNLSSKFKNTPHHKLPLRSPLNLKVLKPEEVKYHLFLRDKLDPTTLQVTYACLKEALNITSNSDQVVSLHSISKLYKVVLRIE